MFQWSLTLSDKQVMMLMAMFRAEPDARGCQFYAALAMVGDAWDVRSARKLQEAGLLDVREHIDGERKSMVWSITMKGRLICEAIMEDAAGLSNIKGLKRWDGRCAIDRSAVPRKKK